MNAKPKPSALKTRPSSSSSSFTTSQRDDDGPLAVQQALCSASSSLLADATADGGSATGTSADAAAAAALAVERGVVGATIPTKLRNLNSNNSGLCSANNVRNNDTRTRCGIHEDEGELAHCAVKRSGYSGRTFGADHRRHGPSSKRSTKTTPITALPHYRCARATYESTAAFLLDESTASDAAPPLSSQHSGALQSFPQLRQPPPIPYQAPHHTHTHPRQQQQQQQQQQQHHHHHISSPSRYLASGAAPAPSAAQLVRQKLSQDLQDDIRLPTHTLEAMLLRQKQQQQEQQQASPDRSQPCLASMTDAGSRRGTTSNAAAQAYPVVSLDDLAQVGAILKPRRTSTAALLSDFAPSKVDVVVDLRSESANGGSSSSPSSDASSSAAANACRLVGSAPAFEAVLNRLLPAYIESSRRSRSHLIDHVLALVQRSGGLFCRFDASCHCWIQVGYETSFDCCVSEFKASARDVLKRIQLLRSLERHDHESGVEGVEQPSSAVVPLTPISLGYSQDQGSNVLLTRRQQQPSADAHWVRPKPPPGPQPATLSSREPPSSQLSVPGSITSNQDSPGSISSRDEKLKTKFKWPKRKGTATAALMPDSARCERASAPHPTSPMPRRITNEQESTTSANL